MTLVVLYDSVSLLEVKFWLCFRQWHLAHLIHCALKRRPVPSISHHRSAQRSAGSFYELLVLRDCTAGESGVKICSEI